MTAPVAGGARLRWIVAGQCLRRIVPHRGKAVVVMVAGRIMEAPEFGLLAGPSLPRTQHILAALGLDLRDRWLVRPRAAIRTHLVELVADASVCLHPAVVFFP